MLHSSDRRIDERGKRQRGWLGAQAQNALHTLADRYIWVHTTHDDHHHALVDALMAGDHHLARNIMAEKVQACRKRVMEALIATETPTYPLLLVSGAD